MIKLALAIFAALVAVTSAEEDFHFVHCCEFKELVDHAIGAKCHQQATSSDKKEQFKARACEINCIVRDMNLTDGPNLSIPKFIQMVDTVAADSPDSKKFYTEKITECESKVNEMEKHHKEHKDHDDPNCSKKIFFIMMCLGKKLALECPADKKINSADCDSHRQFFEKMGEKFEKHHGKH